MNKQIDPRQIALIAHIADELEQYRDDEDVFWDSLDGETDALDILDRLILARSTDMATAEGIKSVIDGLTKRKARIEARAKATTRLVGDVLKAAGMKKAERPAATVSVREGSLSVSIEDEADIPTQLMREKVTRSPDKTAIKKQLEAGETVPGASLTRGSDVVTVRVV